MGVVELLTTSIQTSFSFCLLEQGQAINFFHLLQPNSWFPCMERCLVFPPVRMCVWDLAWGWKWEAWLCMVFCYFVWHVFPPAAWIDLFPNAVPTWALVCWANYLKNCTSCKLTLVLTSGLELLARKGMCWMTWKMNAMQTMRKLSETTRHASISSSSPLLIFKNLMHVDLTLIANFAMSYRICFWERMLEWHFRKTGS